MRYISYLKVIVCIKVSGAGHKLRAWEIVVRGRRDGKKNRKRGKRAEKRNAKEVKSDKEDEG